MMNVLSAYCSSPGQAIKSAFQLEVVAVVFVFLLPNANPEFESLLSTLLTAYSDWESASATSHIETRAEKDRDVLSVSDRKSARSGERAKDQERGLYLRFDLGQKEVLQVPSSGLLQLVRRYSSVRTRYDSMFNSLLTSIALPPHSGYLSR
ncbi:galactoside 2-alpha-L-fucosyltransferase-like protein [Corchorus olitorius]|uniref:Galactoside 2-alpha-L-fucosyltransferase-like protein n=1 Tax=Corchorus olitorius TaxID=93759 RepID=A0A1R3L2E0_9ROSI|nr:galactoside 2-alpha-L-fucosyltransferase-like protein [Corchorus olitorius]